MDYRSQLIALVTAYAAARRLSEARIGVLAVNSGKIFKALRDGGGCTVDTYLKLKSWFAENWPDGTPWPDGCDQPGKLPTVVEAA